MRARAAVTRVRRYVGARRRTVPRPLPYPRPTGPARGSALVSYLPGPVADGLAGRPETQFSNRGIARSIPQALTQLGYEVDVVSWDDATFTPARRYDVLVQHGGLNFEALRARLDPAARVLYFSTGGYWRFHNAQERARLDALEDRHGIRLAQQRLVGPGEEAATRGAAGIVAVGSATVAETFPKDFPLILPIDLAVYPDGRDSPKDVAAGRDNVLFFAGGGNVHKGLDLAIDAFLGIEQHLYVATYLESDFTAAYAPILEGHENVHLLGPVEFRSRVFYELMDRCTFVLLPSCSEGQPGSVLEAMHQGLVPIVSRECNLDVDGFGLVPPRMDVDTLRTAVQESAARPTVELAAMSAEARRVVAARHAPERFVQSFAAVASAALGLG